MDLFAHPAYFKQLSNAAEYEVAYKIICIYSIFQEHQIAISPHCHLILKNDIWLIISEDLVSLL